MILLQDKFSWSCLRLEGIRIRFFKFNNKKYGTYSKMFFFFGWKSCSILSRRKSFIRFLKNVSGIFSSCFLFFRWICTAPQMQYTYFFIKLKYSIIERVLKTILPKTNFWKLFIKNSVVWFHFPIKKWPKISIDISN